MRWEKLDAALASALADDDGARRYLVFIHGSDGPVRTATVSAADVDRLSEGIEVRQLRLSRRLKLSDEP